MLRELILNYLWKWKWLKTKLAKISIGAIKGPLNYKYVPKFLMLTCFVFNNKSPYIDASCKVLLPLLLSFQRRRVSLNQSIRYKNCPWWPCFCPIGTKWTIFIKDFIKMPGVKFGSICSIWLCRFRESDFSANEKQE